MKVANAIYLTRTTYCSYENGTKPIDMQTIDALANLYDISFDSLVNYDLSDGMFHRIYFNEENKDMAEMLNAYQYLSIPSKLLLSQRMDMLRDKEKFLYSDSKKKKAAMQKNNKK
ncbi:MAG: helix-turn-helix transcriptional regulator [Firmicutes bacterium]|nr:helix-turn-helix transcriptional regulator [Bacillota bacterium]